MLFVYYFSTLSYFELVAIIYYSFCLTTHLLAIMFGYLRLHSWNPRKESRFVDDVPGVSLIKPLIGKDKNTKSNLESFFKINYPKYDLHICIAEKEEDHPPSLSIVKELMEAYPDINVKITTGALSVGVNPKINNMLTGYQAAQYELLWFTDANIITQPDTLTELVSKISNNKVGLVHQIPFFGPTRTFGEYLNKVYFGTQQARAYLFANLLGINCTTGMSLLIRKSALEQGGGLASFADCLAEDYAISKSLKSSGYKIVLSSIPVIQNPGICTFAAFKSRVIRWCRLRAALIPLTIIFEPFIECPLSGLIGCIAIYCITGWSRILVFLMHCLYWFTCDMILMSILEDGPVGPLWKVVIAWLTRESWALPLLLRSLSSRQITWGGNTYKLLFGAKAIKLTTKSPIII